MADKSACAHLRVRLHETDKEFLASLSQREGGKSNISKAVKQLIEREKLRSTMIEIYPHTREKIERLTKLLRRTDAQVIDESVESILAMIEDDKVPLLVMELRLVKTYSKRPPGRKSNSN
jgi:predicted DNA-binding protein